MPPLNMTGKALKKDTFRLLLQNSLRRFMYNKFSGQFHKFVQPKNEYCQKKKLVIRIPMQYCW